MFIRKMIPMKALAMVLAFVAIVACTKKTQTSDGGGAGAPPAAEKGKKVYATYCIACHAPDPHVDGAVGPAIYGSSLDLLEHRVLKTDYPAGYRAKRSTHIMPQFPYLKDDIPALHAYLNSP